MGQEPDLVDRLAAAAIEVKGLLSDLHTAQKALRQDIASAREMIKELDAAKERFVRESLVEEVNRQFALLNTEIKAEMARAVKKVNKEFTKLENILLGKTDSGTPLEEVVKRMAPGHS